MTGLTSPEARAIQALLEHPDGVHIPRGMHPSGAGSKTWRRLIDRGLVLRVVDPAGAGRGSTWSVTPRGREVYAAVIDAIAEDFADALRAEPGDWVELRPNVFADRLEYEDVPRWENEGGALMDYRRWDDSDGPADSHDVDAVVNAALRGLAS